MSNRVPAGASPHEPRGLPRVEYALPPLAVQAFGQAAAARASAAQCMSATLRHVAAAVLAAGGDQVEAQAALDAAYRHLTYALDGALGDVVAELLGGAR